MLMSGGSNHRVRQDALSDSIAMQKPSWSSMTMKVSRHHMPDGLKKEGFKALQVSDGTAGLEQANSAKPT